VVEQPDARGKSRARERSATLACTKSDVATRALKRENIVAGKQRQDIFICVELSIASGTLRISSEKDVYQGRYMWKGDMCQVIAWHSQGTPKALQCMGKWPFLDPRAG